MKNPRPLLLSRPFVMACLAAGFVLAVTTAALITVSTRDMASASNRVNRTQATLLDINQLLSLVTDMEAGQRGHTLTGLEDYLAPYTLAAEALDAQLIRLRQHFAASPEQLATLDRIAGLLTEKQAEMNRTIELRRTDAIGPALHIVDSGAGLKAMNALRTSLHELEQRELSDLALRSTTIKKRATFFEILGLGLVVTACLLAVTIGRLLMRRMRELETMITVCAWTHRVKFNGAWVSFEEYLRNRFNLRFTHGISEEASKKLQMEAIALLGADQLKKAPGHGIIPPTDAWPTVQKQ
jgi:CHASE3 domain sensor protein